MPKVRRYWVRIPILSSNIKAWACFPHLLKVWALYKLENRAKEQNEGRQTLLI
jgi:hypothetical protein